MMQQSLPNNKFIEAIKAVGSRQPLLHPFSKDEIPIEIGYVNLRIVSQDAQANGGPDVYVDVKNIFNPTADTSAISDNLQKVIVYGQPGTGKSILCHHIASQWSSKDKLWNDRYTGVIWLTFSEVANYDFKETEDTAELAHLTDVLDNIYFSKTVNSNTEAFLTDNPEKVLFILDGYDEAKDRLQNKKIASQVLKYIAKNFSMIITSRSAEVMIDHEAMVFDHVLENVGFTQDNIEHYIENHLSKEEREKLISLIDNNQEIRDIVSIPLNLYMLCKIWSKNYQVKEIQNVTDLYVEITEMLFKEAFIDIKPESRKGKEKEEDDESTQKSLIFAERQEAVKQIHEELALEVMKNNYSSIGDNLLNAKVDTIKKLHGIEDSEEEKLYDDVLNTKIIKIVKDKTSGQIVFPHHTFVEFFAAKAIVRYLSTGTSHDYKKVCDLVKEHKYNPYFEVVWLRTAGLLYQEYNRDRNKSDLKLQMFFDLIENEPRELIGIEHRIFLTKLLYECNNFHVAQNDSIVLNYLSQTYLQDDIIEEQGRVLKGNFDTSIKAQAILNLSKLSIKVDKIPKVISILEEGLRDNAVGINSLSALCLAYIYCKEIKDDEYFIYNIARKLRYGLSRLNHQDFKNKYDEQALKTVSVIFRQAILEIEKIQNSNEVTSSADSIQQLYDTKVISIIIESNFETSRIVFTAIAETICLTFFTRNVSNNNTELSMPSRIIANKLHKTYKDTLGYIEKTYLTLDQIVRKNPADLYEKILEIAQTPHTVLNWSKRQTGLLDLTLAIRLYSFSSISCNKHIRNRSDIWLEPIHEISFIKKNTNSLVLEQDVIVNPNVRKGLPERSLTKTTDQTNAVLKAIEQAFKTEKLTNPAINHYLYGTCLDVSGDGKTPKETRYFILRCIQGTSSIPYLPKKATELRAAAAVGDLEKVQQILQDEKTDVDDRDLETGNTALMLAVMGKHWDVMEYLIEKGADVSFGNYIGKTIIDMLCKSGIDNETMIYRYLLKKSLSNEIKLQSSITKATTNYVIANAQGREEILTQLAFSITDRDRSWEKDRDDAYEYRSNVENIQSVTIEDVQFQARGTDANSSLKARLHIYLRLFVRLSTGISKDYPSNDNCENTLLKLYEEIKILAQAHNFLKMLLILPSEENYRDIFFESIVSNFALLKVGEEYIIPSGYAGHSIYVAFYKLNKDKLLIRIDNRFESIHIPKTCIEQIEGKQQIKSYCLGVIDLNNECSQEHLKKYVKDLVNINKRFSEQSPIIYGFNLPNTIQYNNNLARNIVDTKKWPWHPVQQPSTNNCIISSYNMGISVRQGMDFFSWLIDQEWRLGPSYNIVAASSIFSKKIRQGGIPNDTVLINAVSQLAYSHSTLIEKFQKELNVAYTEVFIGIAVEQTLVELSGITTKQNGASFRKHDENTTKFNLRFTNEDELGKFISYYNDHYQSLIVSKDIELRNGWATVLMSTRILYEQVSYDIGKIEKLATEQNTFKSNSWSRREDFNNKDESNRRFK